MDAPSQIPSKAHGQDAHATAKPFFRRYASRFLFVVNLAFWGCGGSGCPCGDLCPAPDPNNPPITGSITWRPSAASAVMDVVPIPAGTATPKKICIEMIGADPSKDQIPAWTLQTWLQHLRIGARATDQDSAFPRVYDIGTEEECDYNTSTTAFGFISPVQYEWSGNIEWKTGEYELTVTVKNSPTQHYPPDYIANPNCTVLPVETVTGKVTLVLYKITANVTGPNAVERGSEGKFEASFTIEGFDPKPSMTYDWRSNHINPPAGGGTSWSGTITEITIVDCKATFRFPNDCFLIGGTTRTIAPPAVQAQPLARKWFTLFSKETRFPYRSDGNDIGRKVRKLIFSPCDSRNQDDGVALFGTAWAYPYPNGFLQGADLAADLNVVTVSDDGPCSGRSYVKDARGANLNIDVNSNSHLYDAGDYLTNNFDLVADQIACVEAHENWHFDNFVKAEAIIPDVVQQAESSTGDSKFAVRLKAAESMQASIDLISNTCPGIEEHCGGAPPDPSFPGFRCSLNGPIGSANDGEYCAGDVVCAYE